MNTFFRDTRRLLLLLPAAALALCLAGLYLTRGSMADLSFLSDPNSSLVDERPWQTVQALAPLAVTAEEQSYARQAERLADHEVDQAFALALREATDHATRALTGEALALSERVKGLQAIVHADQANVTTLTGHAKDPAGASAGDSLDIAKTQLQLDSDELSDATAALERASGDKRQQIQQELAVREASMKAFDASGGNPPAPAASISERRRATLSARASAWFDQRSRYKLVRQAQHQAEADAQTLDRQHRSLAAQSASAAQAASVSLRQDAASEARQQTAAADQTALTRAAHKTADLLKSSAARVNPLKPPPPLSTPAAAASAPPPSPDAALPEKPLSRSARLALLENLSVEHSIVIDRLATQQRLAEVYNKWAIQIERQHSILLHLILESLAWIAVIILCAVLGSLVLEHLLDRPAPDRAMDAAQPSPDRRTLRTLHTIILLAIEVVALLCILLVVFGPPSQIPTIIGLATAGLTVVFQSFILAFFGWFVLMGKRGIRVGDWVEINSVAGEVVEISLFRTALLETGNWTDKGHPTGRRISFINNFAITGQYFNFSTAGQWMWDEITVHIPPGSETSPDSEATIEAIHKKVLAETSANTKLAEAEWQQATRQQGLSQFKAMPSVDRRPAASGVDIIIRYVTRASDRFEMRNKLYQAVIDLLNAPQPKLPQPKS